ncbi:MAG TPA: hypothetical protein PK199_06870 [Bacteroidales bacterium]|nr:hypothetical protein [Bacteroidales bacterium]
MKKVVVLVVSICLAFVTFAQRPTAKKAQIANFENFTLYVVLNQNPTSEYNDMIREAVRKSWRVSKYDFITQSEFETKRTEENSAFLVTNEISFPKDKNVIQYDFISIILGGNFASYQVMPEVCTFPLMYTDTDEGDMLYKLPVVIGFFNQHVKNILVNPKLLKDKKYKYYTKQKLSIAKKTLYLIAEEQLPEFDNAQKIRPVFKGKVVMIGQEEMANLIKKRATNVVFLHKVGPADASAQGSRCYIIMMGTDNTLYYFNYHILSAKAPNGISPKYWKIFVSHTK